MTLAQFAVEIRRRAALVAEIPEERLEDTVERLGALAHAGHDQEAKAIRAMLVALLHSDHESDFSSATLDALSPETLRRLEALLEGLLAGGFTTERLRAVLRPVLVRSVT